jgi:PIN domain nuclease of toxin-antitoxin system
MNLLLDTNVLLWLLSDDKRLNVKARDIIASAESIAYSEATLWEISIKVSIGKLHPIPKLYDTLYGLGFRRLTLKNEYLSCYENLPLIHRDPFDRILIAQATVEKLALVTSDVQLQEYDIKVINAS